MYRIRGDVVSTNALINIVQQKEYRTIRIAGNGASGKSTLAKSLNRNQEFQIICTDDYLLDGEVRAKMYVEPGKRVTANCLEAYDFTELIVLLEKLKKNKQQFIVEGIGSHFLNDEYFELSIFYSVSKKEEKKRRIARGESFTTQKQLDDFEERRKQFKERINISSKQYDIIIRN